MNRRRTLSAASLALAITLTFAPAATAAGRTRGPERAQPSSHFEPLAFLGAWLGHLLGLDSSPAAQGTGCGEAGPHIDPNGCPAAGAPSGANDAGPMIDPNGR